MLMLCSYSVMKELIAYKRHDMESCDQSGEDEDKAWLDEPVAMVKDK